MQASSKSLPQPLHEHRVCAAFIRCLSYADILEDPAIKAKFQEVVAATVRAQLEMLGAGGVSLSQGRQQEELDRSARRDTYGYRER